MVGRWVLVPKIGVRVPIPQVCTGSDFLKNIADSKSPG